MPKSLVSHPAMDALAAEARTVARDAYIYGFPLVDSYRIQHAYFVDRRHPAFKGPWNQVHHTARVVTPGDTTVPSPNADTPYSILGADLRAEPLVISLPAVEPSRYFSVQFIDLDTFNFGYAGSRTTGHEPARIMLAGPDWTGRMPVGVTSMMRCDTELALAIYRTQLFSPADLDNVRRVQAGYTVQTLSSFLGKPAPIPVPPIAFVTPISAADERSSLEFYNILNFVLQFCPVHPEERSLLARFRRIGVGSHAIFDAGSFPPDVRRAIEDGMADAWQALADFKSKEIDTGRVTSADLFGNRAHMKKRYLHRMAAAVLGIYGNSKEEAIYPAYYLDSAGRLLDGATHRYALRFPPGELPPVNAFWSLTLYELPSRLLSANALNRYLINSAMLPNLTRDGDGGVTLHIQHDAPAGDRRANWLPAPSGPFFCALRLYWPTPEALDGPWRQPPMTAVDL